MGIFCLLRRQFASELVRHEVSRPLRQNMSLPTPILRLTSWRFVFFHLYLSFQFCVIFLPTEHFTRHSFACKEKCTAIPKAVICMLTPRSYHPYSPQENKGL